ncbi:MAG: hypothetical protein WC095_02385 [Candidatus Paceibacterota bacterium]
MRECKMRFIFYPFEDEKTSCILPRGHKGNHLGRFGNSFIEWQINVVESIITVKEAILKCGGFNKE